MVPVPLLVSVNVWLEGAVPRPAAYSLPSSSVPSKVAGLTLRSAAPLLPVRLMLAIAAPVGHAATMVALSVSPLTFRGE